MTGHFRAILAFATALSLTGCTSSSIPPNTEVKKNGAEGSTLLFAAPGRVEAKDNPLDLGVAENGVLSKLLVQQNDPVHAGQILAKLDCRDLQEDVARYDSEMRVEIRTKARMVVGGRPDDRAAAVSRVQAAEATLRERQAWYERMKKLLANDTISKSAFDQAEREWRTAEADYETAVEQSRSVAAEPLPEDLAKADAQIRAASDRMKSAKALLSKCTVISPITGTVLRTYATEGEFLSSAYPKAILTVADLSRLRVRAEVDEEDIAQVEAAHRISVVSDSLPGSTFPARIAYEAPAMGRIHTRTGDPAERSDRDIREVLIDLDPSAQKLPLGLRVTIQFWR